MGFFIVKVLVTSLIVAGVSELAKRNTFFAAVIISLPIVSILSFIWTYVETKDAAKIENMSREIFWLLLPSLLFFVVFPLLMQRGLHFYWSLLAACVAMAAGYAGYVWVLKKFGIGQ